MEEKVEVSIMEMMRLNEINLRHKKLQLETTDMTISIMKKVYNLKPETPLQELEETQSQLRAMMNKAESDLKIIEEDKQFLGNIMKRSKN